MTNREATLLLYLLGKAVHGEKADKDKVKELSAWCREEDPAFSMDGLLKKARLHLTDALAAWALDDPAYRKYVERAIYRTASFDLEREKILDLFEQRGIWQLPLKGAVLGAYYPVYGLRQFSDNDILADPDRIGEVTDLMNRLGYRSEPDCGVHIGFHRPPMFNFEIHYKLFSESFDPAIGRSYRDIKSRMIRDEGCRYRYHLPEKEFYQMMVIHAWKHYHGAGTGFRTLLDFYVCLARTGSQVQPDQIREELRKLCPDGKLLRFEETMRNLSRKLLDDPDHVREAAEALSGEEMSFFLWMRDAGAYGTTAQQTRRVVTDRDVSGVLTRTESLKYFAIRMFSRRFAVSFARAHYHKEYPYPAALLMRIGYAFAHFPVCARETRKAVREFRTQRAAAREAE